MSEVLLNRLLNNEVPFDCFKKWFLYQDFNEDYNCSRYDFMSYFLNYIHEEVVRNKFGGDLLKCTPRKIKTNVFNKKTDKVRRSQPNRQVVKSLENSFDSCTPIKKHSDLNESYCSPVSPLYKPVLNTPVHRKKPVCLGDFFVTKSAKKRVSLSKSNESRRITPTTLNQDSFHSNNSFSDFNTTEINPSHLSCDRLNLEKERIQVMNRKECNNLNHNQYRNISMSESNNEAEIEASLDLVSNKLQLDVLCNVYIIILANNYVFNITKEIYFLIYLLSIKQYKLDNCSSSDDEKSSYFVSIHNVVYFAVKCLESQLNDTLRYYDKSTLKLLSNNKRIIEFSPKFAEQIKMIANKKIERTIEFYSSTINNVTYNLDVDSKYNFINDLSFLSFKKQRDLFYEILRIWETNHLQANWCYRTSLSGKIRTLLHLQEQTGNYVYFSRLFKSQLVNSCGLKSTNSLPSDFPEVDPSKLHRLTSRLITKEVNNGLNDLPCFPNQQEFYKDFIDVASNHSFNIHLSDVIINDIIELNRNTFNMKGFGETDTDVDDSIKTSYTWTLNQLRILGKFLGYIEAIPYKLDVNNEQIINQHISIREKKNPSFDVKEILMTSIKCNTLILTIPWLVKYLSMLDYTTLRLPYYKTIYEILFQIYHSNKKRVKYIDYNYALIKFSLGWFFDLLKFPDTEYNKFCMKNIIHLSRDNGTLDNLPIVDQNILYWYCPYLYELKNVLTSNSNCNVRVKHITPVTAIESTEQITKKKLEQQLEEAFFNSQPESVKKTVEFISERIASSCVKYICTTLVPEFKKNSLIEIKSFLNQQSPSKNKLTLRSKIVDLVQLKLVTFRAKCEKEMMSILSDKVPKSIDCLLALDALNQTKNACVSITSKMCWERIKQWIDSHIINSILMKDVDRDLHKMHDSNKKHTEEKKPIFILPPGGRNQQHDDECLSAFQLTDDIRNITMDVLENKKEVTANKIITLLESINKSMSNRCDINDIIGCHILNGLVDFSLLLVAYKPDLMHSDRVFDEFVKVWTKFAPCTDDLFKDLLCSRNIYMLNKVDERRNVWINYARFVALLVKNRLVSCESFEAQCVAFFRRDWDQDTINNVCNFMRIFVDLHKKQTAGDYSKFTVLLEFLTDFCIDL